MARLKPRGRACWADTLAVINETALRKGPRVTNASVTNQVSLSLKWLALQGVLNKALSFFAQFALAWFLAKEDFGLVAMALSVTVFIGVIQNAGVAEVLVQRAKSLPRWINIGFWLSMTMGLIAALLTVLASFAFAKFYQEPRLVGLLLVLAISFPIQSAGTVSKAVLQSGMRFKRIASIGVTINMFRVVLSILLSWAGMGAWAVILPIPISMALQTAMYINAAPLKIRLNPQVGRWRFLLSKSSVLMLSSFAVAIIAQGDYFILGRMSTTEQLGLYFFAFSFAAQAIRLFAADIAQVFLPALSKFRRDTDRQIDAYRRASHTINLVIMPLCFFQAALADPLFALLFEDRWQPSVPLVQMILIGMAFRVLAGPSKSLMKAQGRFTSMMLFEYAFAAIFLAGVYLAARTDDLQIVAMTVAGFCAAYGLSYYFFSINDLAKAINGFTKTYLLPTLIAGAPALLVYFTIQWVDGWEDRFVPTWLQLLLGSFVCAALYLAAAAALDRAGLTQLINLVRRRAKAENKQADSSD